jgi:hypothetical protein
MRLLSHRNAPGVRDLTLIGDPWGLCLMSVSRKTVYHRIDQQVYDLLTEYARQNRRSVASSVEVLLLEALRVPVYPPLERSL